MKTEKQPSNRIKLIHSQVMERKGSFINNPNPYLLDVATCRNVPQNGSKTFFGATQSLWFAHILTGGEDGINAHSIGRIDQFLYPYYKADIDRGLITRKGAVVMMEELACKLYLDYDVQAMTLGGKQRLSQIIKTAIKMRIGQIQFNVVTADCLVQTQQDPENYGNIPVRVAGYSQMFKLIDRDLQNHIIARTKHEV